MTAAQGKGDMGLLFFFSLILVNNWTSFDSSSPSSNWLSVFQTSGTLFEWFLPTLLFLQINCFNCDTAENTTRDEGFSIADKEKAGS